MAKAKWATLVEEYAGQVAEIKAEWAKRDEIYARANNKAKAIEKECGDPFDLQIRAYQEVEPLYAEAQQHDINGNGLYEALLMDLNAEYNAVPFGKVAKQGIDRFLKASGLKK